MDLVKGSNITSSKVGQYIRETLNKKSVLGLLFANIRQ